MRFKKLTPIELALIAAPLVAKGFNIDDALKMAMRIYKAAVQFLLSQRRD